VRAPAHETFGEFLAARIDAEREALATRWLERLCDLVPQAPQAVFPSESLLDHIPALLSALATFISSDEAEAAFTLPVQKGREIGALRHLQKASVHQLLREFELLRNVLEAFAIEEAHAYGPAAAPSEVIAVLRRVNSALAVLSHAAVGTFVERYDTTIAEQQHRLVAFSRMLSHELRQPLNAALAGAGLLERKLPQDDAADSRRLLAVIERNLHALSDLIRKVSTVAAKERSADGPGIQNVSLSAVAREAARQLRTAAEARNVRVDVAMDLPEVVTDPGHLEIILVNLLSNAIKYCDPAKPECRAEVALVECSDVDCLIAVRDNGIGMDARQLARVFAPFVRVHASRDQELGTGGTGLGLSIVRDCADLIGATITVESSPGKGTTFLIGLPLKDVRSRNLTRGSR